MKKNLRTCGTTTVPRTCNRTLTTGDGTIDEDEADRLNQLLDVTGVTQRKAEGLLDEYGNLYTVAWAATHDDEYVQREFKINPEFLREQMMEAGVWKDYWSHKTRLQIPDRRQDWYDEVHPDEKQTRWSEYTDG